MIMIRTPRSRLSRLRRPVVSESWLPFGTLAKDPIRPPRPGAPVRPASGGDGETPLPRPGEARSRWPCPAGFGNVTTKDTKDTKRTAIENAAFYL